jgi:hypothetical protein
MTLVAYLPRDVGTLSVFVFCFDSCGSIPASGRVQPAGGASAGAAARARPAHGRLGSRHIEIST